MAYRDNRHHLSVGSVRRDVLDEEASQLAHHMVIDDGLIRPQQESWRRWSRNNRCNDAFISMRGGSERQQTTHQLRGPYPISQPTNQVLTVSASGLVGDSFSSSR